MAERLKDQYGPEIPRAIARMIAAVFPAFNRKAFLRDSLAGYEGLELLDRGRQIASALRSHLPSDYAQAVEVLVASAGTHVKRSDHAMASFLYMPYLSFVGTYGLDHFEISMAAQYELTQKFSAEFSIRPFIERYPDAALEKLREWALDSNEDVRRLVSEGTRPRLPWASRLRIFEKNPGPVLELLELLKDDPSLYVRRSVANHLNDLGKSDSSLLIQTARTWWKDATPERRWIIRHALRSLVKSGSAGALALLGFGSKPSLSLVKASLYPAIVKPGGEVWMTFDLASTTSKPQTILVDFRVHYIKANGEPSPKVFKLRTIQLGPRETCSMAKKISLEDRTTRKHYPGAHQIDLLINGRLFPLGEFTLSRQTGH